MTTAAEPAGRVPQASVPLAECALARAIRAIGDGWTLLILREALCGVERFEAMREDLRIPRSVLSDRLSRLVDEGLLERRPYREPGRRARQGYALTEKGRALAPALVALRAWAEAHLPGGRSRLHLRTADGRAVAARLMLDDGTVIDDATPLVPAVLDASTEPSS